MSQPPQAPQTPPHGAQHGPYTFDANRGEWIFTAAAPPAGYPPVQPPKKRKVWPWVVVGVVVVLVVGFFALVVTSSSTSHEDDAIELCESLVRDNATSPSSVQFVGSTASAKGTNKWEVRGDVDWQNSFGATVRNGFACQVQYNPDTQMYTGQITEQN